MRTCTICKHSKRLEIERAILAEGSFRDIAGQFEVSKSAVERRASGALIPNLANFLERRLN